MLSIAKGCICLFRNQRTTVYLSVSMHVVATLLDIKLFQILNYLNKLIKESIKLTEEIYRKWISNCTVAQ
jgi:hypothetical protein